jgi:lipid-A-disaccharide synthase-like uncharacterized protein
MENWRFWLYPLGFLPSVFFFLRFFIQWVQSEKEGRTAISPIFWHLSIAGNFLLGVHGLIQLQYAVSLFQAINGVIAARNLNLMAPSSRHWTLRTTLWLLGLAVALPTLYFLIFTPTEWMRVPEHFFSSGKAVSPLWHIAGSLGMFLFALRFWVQWVQAEKAQQSSLAAPFWWLSLLGAFLSFIYFAAINDPVNYLGPLFILALSARQIFIIKKTDETSSLRSSR